MTAPWTRRAVVLLAWCAAAALAASVTWWTVSLVGRGRGAAEDALLSQAQVAADLAAERAAASQSPTPSQTPQATSEPSTPAGDEIARTWDVTGGRVSASCRGDDIGLLSYTPNDGWSVEAKHSGPQEIEVEFRRGESETTLNARCVDGIPQEQVEADD